MANQHHVKQDQEPCLNLLRHYHRRLRYFLDLGVQIQHLLEDLRDTYKQPMHLVIRREIDSEAQADNQLLYQEIVIKILINKSYNK